MDRPSPRLRRVLASRGWQRADAITAHLAHLLVRLLA